MKCQILFSGKNKKNINLSSADLAQRVVMVNMWLPLSPFSLEIACPFATFYCL